MADGQNKVADTKPPIYIRVFDFISYVAFLVVERIILLIPHGPGRKVGRALAWLWYQVDWKRYTIAMKNLRRAFSAEKSPAEIKRICRASYLNLGETFVDLVRMTDMNRENRLKYFVYDPEVDVNAAVKEMVETGKGIVAISAHLGSQEMLVGYLLEWGVGRENIVTKRIKNPYLNRYIQAQRGKLGVHVIPHRKSAKEIIRRMKSGEITVFLLDQRASYHEGVRVNFFGEPVVAHKAVAQLAMAFQLPVHPIFAIKNGDGRYRIIVKEKLTLANTGNFDEDTRANSQLFQNVIEEMVRQYPEQWLWVHNRWKRGENAPLK